LDINEKTVSRWMQHPDFSAEVDNLTLMMGIASRAERLRIAKRLVKQRVNDERVESDKDLLDWLKYAQGETQGIKLDLATLAEFAASVASGRSDGVPAPADGGRTPRSGAAGGADREGGSLP
jgi:L-arabinose isomerase